MHALIDAKKPRRVVHIAHTLGRTSTWRRHYTGFQKQFGYSPEFLTAARYEPWVKGKRGWARNKPIEAFGTSNAVRDIGVFLERR